MSNRILSSYCLLLICLSSDARELMVLVSLRSWNFPRKCCIPRQETGLRGKENSYQQYLCVCGQNLIFTSCGGAEEWEPGLDSVLCLSRNNTDFEITWTYVYMLTLEHVIMNKLTFSSFIVKISDIYMSSSKVPDRC